MEQIRIIHTNDLHSHLDKWPKIRRFIKERQQPAENERIITVDLGDFADRWHPLTEASDGKENVVLMNQVDYDYVTIGNNEGTGNSKAQLDGLYEDAQFEVLLANLFDKSTLQRPKWVKPYAIKTTPEGIKVGIIALTAYFPLTYEPNGWDIRTWQEILPHLVATLRPQVDVLVLLSHLGIEEDRVIAQECSELDVIIGSHTHHLFQKGERMNGVLVAAAGKFGLYVGEVVIQLAQQSGVRTITHKEARTFETDQMLSFPEDQAEIDSYVKKGQAALRASVVTTIEQPLPIAQADGPNLINEALEALKSRAKTEVALLNTGLFLRPLQAGVVTQEDLHQLLPHPMHLVRVTLTGQEMIRFVKEIEKNRSFLRRFPIVGMGFRGKIFGDIVMAGIHYDEINDTVLWQGNALEEVQEYTFATVDHWVFIPFFPTLEIAGKIEFLFPEFIRTVLGNYLNQKNQLCE